MISSVKKWGSSNIVYKSRELIFLLPLLSFLSSQAFCLFLCSPIPISCPPNLRVWLKISQSIMKAVNCFNQSNNCTTSRDSVVVLPVYLSLTLNLQWLPTKMSPLKDQCLELFHGMQLGYDEPHQSLKCEKISEHQNNSMVLRA